MLTGIFKASELKTGISLQAVRSSNETLSPYRDSPTAFLDWLQHLETGELVLASRYAETATRDTSISALGPVYVNSTQTSRSVSAKWTQSLSELSTFTADSAYDSVVYQGGPYIDYAAPSANLMLSHALSERSKPFVKMSYIKYIPLNGGASIQYAGAILGLNWKVSDSLEGSLYAGKFKLSGATNLGNLGGATVQYTGERNQLAFNSGRQVAPSGVGGFVINDQVTGSWIYNLSELSRTGLDLGLQRSMFNSTVYNRSAGVWLQYDLNSYWGIRTYYRRNTLFGDGLDNASSSILGITLEFTDTDF